MKDLLIEGTFRANERGFGFVTIDPEEPDVYIPKEATNCNGWRYGFNRRDPTCEILFQIAAQKVKSKKLKSEQ